MSQLLAGKTNMTREDIVRLAAVRCNATILGRGQFTVYSSTIAGFGVKFPNWRFPLVIDLDNGEIHYDNYEGSWGDIAELSQFKQAYTAELVRDAAKKMGHSVTESVTDTGEIRLVVGVDNNDASSKISF